ncbi:MAG: Ig-like domain repeat protein [Nocardioidaceae bacterium]
MNKRATRIAAAGAVGAAVLTGAGVAAVAASSNTVPADANRVGAITLKVNGATVTSGRLSDKLTAVGAPNGALTGERAVVFAYVHGAAVSSAASLAKYKPTTQGTWSGTQLTTAVPNHGLSVPLGSSVTLQQFLAGYHPDANGLVELRLKTISAGQSVSSAYDAVDIYVNAAAGTWSAAARPGGSATGTKKATVKESVAKRVKHTAKLKVKVTVSGAGAGAGAGAKPTGTVSVLDGSKKLAAAKLKAGKATITLPRLKKGKHKIKTTYSGSSTFAAASSKTITVISK